MSRHLLTLAIPPGNHQLQVVLKGEKVKLDKNIHTMDVLEYVSGDKMFRIDCPTETSTKMHVEIPVEMIHATYANGTQLAMRKFPLHHLSQESIVPNTQVLTLKSRS